MADHVSTTSAGVFPLPGAGPFAGKRSHRDKLEHRKLREIVLLCLEENQRAAAYYVAQAARCTGQIAELTAELRALDGYRTPNWGDDPRPPKERA